jgi:hypothetical protein
MLRGWSFIRREDEMAKSAQPPDFSVAQESARQAAAEAGLGDPTGAVFANRVRSRRFLTEAT